MSAYYNEIDPFAADWLENLIADGLIAPGDVDRRSIADVQPDDLRGYAQCHFFAGIGGWSYALRLAGWPDDREVWTGSCPCQPFSVAGKGRGAADERHLWPEFARLIGECGPATVFGEQVASADGRLWLHAVFADLARMGYRRAGADLCAAGVGAPHIRQRLWWVAERDVAVADAAIAGRGEQPLRDAGADGRPAAEFGRLRDLGAAGPGVGLAYACRPGLEGSDARPLGRERPAAERGGAAGGMADGDCERQSRRPESHVGPQRPEQPASRRPDALRCGGLLDPWSDLVWIPCRDGKARPTKPGLFPLAHGVPNRVGTLRGAGNAIVPQVAAEFITAYLETGSDDGFLS